MAGQPDLFVVCKNCRAEVSPYITECPYCGSRLRKRAPKLDKGGVPKTPKTPKARRRRAASAVPRLSRLRPGEMPGVLTAGKPIVTIALVLTACVYNVLWRGGIVDLSLVPLFSDEWHRHLFAPFFYATTSYQVCALAAIFLFGWLLERRHGSWAPLVVFVLATAAGSGSVIATGDDLAYGGNAAALGLLGAWVVRDLLTMRRGEEIEGDLVGVGFIAALLVALPAGLYEPDPLAGLAGATAGLLLGLGLARLPEK